MSSENKKILWDNRLSFILAMIGSAVGLGNIWRFPYIAYTNGGGAFLLPYIISIILIGIPTLFIEYGAGFKFKAGINKVLREINTKFEPIAWFIQLIPFFILTYYTCVIAWDLLYIPASFVKGWGTNPDNFFNIVILQSTNDISGLFSIAIYVFIAILIIWAIVWFISHRNLNEGIGKANKVLIPLLFLMMIIIVAFSFTLPGSDVGRASLLTPDWSSIGNFDIWIAAVGQIVFSLNLGLTIVLAYASYLPDDVDIPKSALTVAIANSAFELFTAIGIFGILGFMSTQNGIPLDQLVTQGTGLAFIAFPQIFNTMGILGTIIGPIFFTCILFAGITSAISLVEPLTLSLTNKFAIERKKLVSYICIIGLLISIIYTTSLGSTILGIFDTFLNQFGLILNIILEIIIIGWIYGLDKLLPGLNKNATILKLGKTWTFIVKYVILIVIAFLWIQGIVTSLISNDMLTTTVEIILLAILIIVPIVLTKLPARVDDY